jgi:hypothetical protein
MKRSPWPVGGGLTGQHLRVLSRKARRVLVALPPRGADGAARKGKHMNIDTFNHHGVGVGANSVVILNPPRKLSRDEAIAFAAHVLVMAGCADVANMGTVDADFQAVKTAIENA